MSYLSFNSDNSVLSCVCGGISIKTSVWDLMTEHAQLDFKRLVKGCPGCAMAARAKTSQASKTHSETDFQRFLDTLEPMDFDVLKSLAAQPDGRVRAFAQGDWHDAHIALHAKSYKGRVLMKKQPGRAYFTWTITTLGKRVLESAMEEQRI